MSNVCLIGSNFCINPSMKRVIISISVMFLPPASSSLRLVRSCDANSNTFVFVLDIDMVANSLVSAICAETVCLWKCDFIAWKAAVASPNFTTFLSSR